MNDFDLPLQITKKLNRFFKGSRTVWNSSASIRLCCEKFYKLWTKFGFTRSANVVNNNQQNLDHFDIFFVTLNKGNFTIRN